MTTAEQAGIEHADVDDGERIACYLCGAMATGGYAIHLHGDYDRLSSVCVRCVVCLLHSASRDVDRRAC